MTLTPEEVVELIKKENVVSVDLKFMDFPGLWQHFSVPVSQFDLDSFKDGFVVRERVYKNSFRIRNNKHIRFVDRTPTPD